MKVPGYLRKDVVQLILESAKEQRTITYGEIMRKCGIPRGQSVRNGKAIGDVVGMISEWTWENWNIYLSAIVVRSSTGLPGGGFFGLQGIPEKLVRTPSEWSDQRFNTQEKTFLRKCQADVFAWAKRRTVA